MVVSAGIGSLTGTWLCGFMRMKMVDANGDGWVEFWSSLSAMIAVCTLIFVLFYKGLGPPRRHS